MRIDDRLRRFARANERIAVRRHRAERHGQIARIVQEQRRRMIGRKRIGRTDTTAGSSSRTTPTRSRSRGIARGRSRPSGSPCSRRSTVRTHNRAWHRVGPNVPFAIAAKISRTNASSGVSASNPPPQPRTRCWYPRTKRPPACALGAMTANPRVEQLLRRERTVVRAERIARSRVERVIGREERALEQQHDGPALRRWRAFGNLEEDLSTRNRDDVIGAVHVVSGLIAPRRQAGRHRRRRPHASRDDRDGDEAVHADRVPATSSVRHGWSHLMAQRS